jgi:hypothetical protein
MSAAMILMAAMVRGDAPHKVSGENVELQRLDLRGQWRLKYDGSGRRPKLTEVDLVRLYRLEDEGEGRFRINLLPLLGKNAPYVGIYRQEKETILMSIRRVGDGRPIRFPIGPGQSILILQRVSSLK